MVIYYAFGYVVTLAFETFTLAVTYSRCILIHFCIPVKSNCFLFEFPKKASFQGHALLCVKQKFLNFDCFFLNSYYFIVEWLFLRNIPSVFTLLPFTFVHIYFISTLYLLLVLSFKGWFFFIIWSEFNGSEVFVEKEIAVALDWKLINKLCSQASGSGKSGLEEKSEKKLLVTSDLS